MDAATPLMGERNNGTVKNSPAVSTAKAKRVLQQNEAYSGLTLNVMMRTAVGPLQKSCADRNTCAELLGGRVEQFTNLDRDLRDHCPE
jgi:hypothetical protein